MAGKGLSSEVIYQAAAELVAEKGYDRFSLRELAARLKVRPASLYSHVRNVDEISTAVGLQAIARMSEALNAAIAGRDREEAVRSFARAYREFALQNPGLYRAIIGIPASDDAALARREQETIAPLRAVVEQFVADESDLVHYQRFLRSALHGFLSLQAAGFMRSPAVSPDASYELLVQSCLDTLEAAAKKAGK